MQWVYIKCMFIKKRKKWAFLHCHGTNSRYVLRCVITTIRALISVVPIQNDRFVRVCFALSRWRHHSIPSIKFWHQPLLYNINTQKLILCHKYCEQDTYLQFYCVSRVNESTYRVLPFVSSSTSSSSSSSSMTTSDSLASSSESDTLITFRSRILLWIKNVYNPSIVLCPGDITNLQRLTTQLSCL